MIQYLIRSDVCSIMLHLNRTILDTDQYTIYLGHLYILYILKYVGILASSQ